MACAMGLQSTAAGRLAQLENASNTGRLGAKPHSSETQREDGKRTS